MGSSYHRINSIVDRKIWGCLAESVSNIERYDKYVEGKHLKLSLREYWSDNEVNEFAKKLYLYFNQRIIIMKKDTMTNVYNRIIKLIGGNLGRL